MEKKKKKSKAKSELAQSRGCLCRELVKALGKSVSQVFERGIWNGEDWQCLMGSMKEVTRKST